MVERKRIGLIFSYDENWIAGTYYILNIIHALKTLDDCNQPHLVILSNSQENFKKVKNETNYPYLEYVQYPFPSKHYTIGERVINKLSRIFFNRNSIVKRPKYPDLDFLYPSQVKGLSNHLKKVNWIPDFQEDYLPQFFSEKEILSRKARQKDIVANGDIVVLSSEDAKTDFVRLYPNAKAKPFVLRFAVTHPDFSKEIINDLLVKYDLPKRYFFAPNQFWAHKNHIVVLKAVKLLKDKGILITVSMSGKENDYRNLENFATLKNYISKHQLESHIKFLGFLPRTEQLCLFKNAQAILQPSLFEGWSTVVEDAKALGKFVMASNLNVHREQLKDNAWFFNPNNFEDLTNCIENYLLKQPKISESDYNKTIFDFGNKFNELAQLGAK
jgi:glycosyltransferase involved in cell wall biosynthesis